MPTANVARPADNGLLQQLGKLQQLQWNPGVNVLNAVPQSFTYTSANLGLAG